MTNIKKISLNLDIDTQLRVLETLMAEDGQTNLSAYIVYLIYQEKKRREGKTDTFGTKRPVGRPRKVEVEVDKNLYPAPYKGGAPYTAETLEQYYEFQKKEQPPLPKPLTNDEIAKYND